eukprot:71002-Amphidinium_carterae.1
MSKHPQWSLDALPLCCVCSWRVAPVSQGHSEQQQLLPMEKSTQTHAGLADWIKGSASAADNNTDDWHLLWNGFRFVDSIEIRGVCTDQPGALVPAGLAPSAAIELGSAQLTAAGAPGGGAGIGRPYVPTAPGAAKSFTEAQLFEALNLLAQAIPDAAAVSTSMQLLSTRMTL